MSVARRAQFEVQETIPNDETVVYFGQNVQDLDRIIARMNRPTYPRPIYYLHIVSEDTWSQPRRVTIGDMETLRNNLLQVFGDGEQEAEALNRTFGV